MYTWRDIQTIVGFTDEMVSYRNAIVREINFVFSPAFQKIKEDEKIAKSHEVNVSLRESAWDRIKDPVQKKQVEVRIIAEALNPAPDFKAADLAMKYLDFSVQDIGSGLYTELREKKVTSYNKFIDDAEFDKALQFHHYFIEKDSLNDFKFFLKHSIENQLNDKILYLVKKMLTSSYKKLIEDEEIKNTLELEFDRAETETRILDAEHIGRLLGDNERFNRLRAMKALLERDIQKAVLSLEKVEFKEKLKNMVIDCYWEEIDKGKDGIEHYENAFNLAYFGGIAKEDSLKYIEQPSARLLEYIMKKENISDEDSENAVLYAGFSSERDVKNILAGKFIKLIENNDTLQASKLKSMFEVTFGKNEYEEESKVLDMYDRLIETKGVSGIPKGEDNLLAALDVALIFDLGKDEVNRVNSLLSRFYISEGDFEKARMYYSPNNKEEIDFINNEITNYILDKNFSKIYELLGILKVAFPIDIVQSRRFELTEKLKEEKYTADNVADMIVIEDIYKLAVLPYYIYSKFFSFCFEKDFSGIKWLISLHFALKKHINPQSKIKIYRIIDELKIKNPVLAEELQRTYKSILPPTILDWIIYLFNRIFSSE
ncbi:hypothetical protein ACFL40_04685 [candidate division KSB1 bacterium]